MAAHLKIPSLSTGAMLRKACQQGTSIGEQARECMAAGDLVPDPLVEKIVFDCLAAPESHDGYILDGFPRTLDQAASLDTWLEQLGRPLSVVLEIQVPDQEILDRLAARGRSDDDREVVLHRLREYNQRICPLHSYYRQRGLLRVVDGVGSVDEVFQRLRQVVEELL